MTASRRAKRIIIIHVPSEEESSVLKEMAHGNGSNWKACLNLPQTNLREKFTHIKKENFRKSSNNVKNVHIDCLLGQKVRSILFTCLQNFCLLPQYQEPCGSRHP